MTSGSHESLADSLGLHRTLGFGEVAAGGVGGMLSRAVLVLFAFIGFDEVITLAEETHDPTRMVPRALLLALGISTVQTLPGAP